MLQIQNHEARQQIVDRIKNAGKRQFRTTFVEAKWLGRGEAAIGIAGGFANMIIFAPALSRTDCNYDRFLFFGANGVLEHEEAALEASDIRAFIDG